MYIIIMRFIAPRLRGVQSLEEINERVDDDNDEQIWPTFRVRTRISRLFW